MKKVLSILLTIILILSSINYPIKKANAYTNTSYFTKIRIGLKSMANSTLTITLNGEYKFNTEILPSNSTYTLSLSNGKIVFMGQALDEINLIPINYNNSLLTIKSGTITNRYQGDFKFKIIDNLVYPINSLYIEDYLKGVVGFEMSDYFPIEALKAQAVAARNYTLTNLNLYKNFGFDLNDTIECQVYGGYNDKLKNVLRAVDETRGQVQLYNEALVQAFYSASNGGITEVTENVWSSPLPYFVVKQDAYDNELWKPETINYTTSQLNTLLKQKAIISQTDTFIRLDLNSITRYQSGRVATLDVYYKDAQGVTKKITLTKSRTRTAFSVPSSLYNLTYNPSTDVYSFTGKGNGHAVGLSQIGAKNRASAGQTFKDILAFYYHNSYTSSLLPSISNVSIDKTKTIVNQPIKFTIDATGGSGTGYIYRYEIIKDGNMISTNDYTEGNTFEFTPQEAGEYQFKVYMKDKLTNSNFDDTKEFKIVAMEPVTIESVLVNNLNLFTNDTVNISTNVQGGTENYIYKYTVLDSNNLITQYQTQNNNQFSFTPSTKGNYKIRIEVKDTISTNEVDSYNEILLNVYDKPYIQDIKTSAIPFEKRSFDIIASHNEGSNQGVKYKFEVYKDDTLYSQSEYKEDNIYTLTPEQVGLYKVKVYVKDNMSTQEFDDIKELIVNVNPEPVKVSKLPIYWGMRGSDVAAIQSALTFLGYNVGTIDGIFGSKTYNGLVAFQKSVGLNPNGVVDALTLKAINDSYINKLNQN